MEEMHDISSSLECSPLDFIDTNTRLFHLSRDFIQSASTYGRIIISERFCKKKTIPPINLGGVAGGEKYIVQDILFKFAVCFLILLASFLCDFLFLILAGSTVLVFHLSSLL